MSETVPLYDPFSYEIHEDPFPVYKRLRDEAPAYFNQQLRFWALSRYADVRQALVDHDRYCSGQGFTLEDIGEFTLPMLLGMDPPDHTRLRATVNRALTPRQVANLEGPVRDLAAKLLDGIAGAGRADIITDFAARLPMAVISWMLQVPDRDQDRLRGLADKMLHRDEVTRNISDEGRTAAPEIYQYFEGLLSDRRGSRGKGLLSLLLAAEDAGEISHEEILGFCFLLMIAGNETTTKLIGNAVFHLDANPEQRARLLADTGLAGAAVEETLRFDTSTHMMARTLTRDTELHGRTMRAGDKVAVILASANRDERQWEAPDEYDIGRDCSGMLSFGVGIHHCIGAALARIEARVAVEELYRRLPRLEVDREGARRVHSGNVRGFASLPVAF
ncbi:MAG: cytochrome P450 [Deltaproteobacteria bacterium]